MLFDSQSRMVDRHADEYDRILYHFGNSPFHHYKVDAFERHPGTIVLHDFYLGHLLAYRTGVTGTYLNRLYESHGYRAVADAVNPDEALWRYPVNLDFLSRAYGVNCPFRPCRRSGPALYGDTIGRNIRKVGFLRGPARSDRQLAPVAVLVLETRNSLSVRSASSVQRSSIIDWSPHGSSPVSLPGSSANLYLWAVVPAPTMG